MTRVRPPPEVTQAVFAEWRNARRGHGQAEVMNNPLWEWLVESGHGPYVVNEHFGGPASATAGPGWTNDRYGQTATTLPGGTVVLVAGEHEDDYDPDFYIYNDVIVRGHAGDLHILGYSADVFPPTDFHSATLVGNDIVLIGNLGYVEDRRAGETQVAVLDTTTWHIRTLATAGTNPGWIHGHSATPIAGSRIQVSGGVVHATGDRPDLLENGDDWELDLRSSTWHRLTHRGWQQWRLARSDGGPSGLWRHRTDALAERSRKPTGGPLATLYVPPVAHRPVPRRDPADFNVHEIEVDDVPIRYVEDIGGVRVVVVGPLPSATVDALVEDLCTKLADLDGAGYTPSRLA